MKTMFLIAGESGCGKDTLANRISQELNMSILISYSTRPRRKGEGNTHVFIEPKQVADFKDNIAAYTQMADVEYFSTIEQLFDFDIYIIDPIGIQQLVETVKKNDLKINLVPIYIDVPPKVRAERVRTRGDNPVDYEIRQKAEAERFALAKKDGMFKYTVVNDLIDEAVADLVEIINIEKS